ncbi:UNVERIFIED_CONTAM: Skeletor [Trichonephila clavipes]
MRPYNAGHEFVTLTPGYYIIFLWGGVDCAPYLGSEIGAFKTYAHDVEGRVYAVDDRTVYIKGFQYDGQGPEKLRSYTCVL